MTFQATDGAGNPVAGVLAQFAASAGSVTQSAVSDAQGDFSVTFTAPQSGWSASSSATITPSVDGIRSADVSVSTASVPGK